MQTRIFECDMCWRISGRGQEVDRDKHQLNSGPKEATEKLPQEILGTKDFFWTTPDGQPGEHNN